MPMPPRSVSAVTLPGTNAGPTRILLQQQSPPGGDGQGAQKSILYVLPCELMVKSMHMLHMFLLIDHSRLESKLSSIFEIYVFQLLELRFQLLGLFPEITRLSPGDLVPTKS